MTLETLEIADTQAFSSDDLVAVRERLLATSVMHNTDTVHIGSALGARKRSGRILHARLRCRIHCRAGGGAACRAATACS